MTQTATAGGAASMIMIASYVAALRLAPSFALRDVVEERTKPLHKEKWFRWGYLPTVGLLMTNVACGWLGANAAQHATYLASIAVICGAEFVGLAWFLSLLLRPSAHLSMRLTTTIDRDDRDLLRRSRIEFIALLLGTLTSAVILTCVLGATGSYLALASLAVGMVLGSVATRRDRRDYQAEYRAKYGVRGPGGRRGITETV